MEGEFTARFERWEPDLPRGGAGWEATALPTAIFEGGARLHGVAWWAFPV